MSFSEYSSSKFGQSWSLDEKVAERFSKESYNNKNDKGVLVKAMIDKEYVFYHDPFDNQEKEVAINSELITQVELIKSE